MKPIKSLLLSSLLIVSLAFSACGGQGSGSSSTGDDPIGPPGSGSDPSGPSTHVHTEVIDSAVGATCEAPGLTEGSHCSDCGDVLVAQEPIPVKAHNVVNGACTYCKTFYGHEGLVYTLSPSGDYYALTGIGTCTDTELYIDTYNDLPVKAIAQNAFSSCTTLRKITLSDNVTSIGSNAFYGCVNLRSVTLGKNITSLPKGAFQGCNRLAEIINYSPMVIKLGANADTFHYLGYYALEVHTGESKIVNVDDFLFYTYNDVNYLLGTYEESETLVLPDDYNGESYQIYQNAFQLNMKLMSVTLGSKITDIGSSAFGGCRKLVEVVNRTSLEIVKGATTYGSVAANAMEVHDGESKIDTVGDFPFYTFDGVNYLLGYLGNESAIVLPENYKNENYEVYRYACYQDPNLLEVTIGDGVTKIGYGAFQYCKNLYRATIGNNVTTVSSNAFAYCNNLSSLTIGQNVTSFADDALLWSCSITEIINYSKLNISNFSFAPWVIEVHTGESKVVNVDGYIFFEGETENYLTGYIGTETELVLPADYKGGTYAIKNRAFLNREDITAITIPKAVTKIGVLAFSGCTNLESATFENLAWKVETSTGTTYITGLTNTELAADQLKNFYYSYEWILDESAEG